MVCLVDIYRVYSETLQGTASRTYYILAGYIHIYLCIQLDCGLVGCGTESHLFYILPWANMSCDDIADSKNILWS
jgi:hypothetical protein